VIVRIDPVSPVPVYEQVRQQILRLAASGRLPIGTRLPTIRQLAADLGIAKGTVERAFASLEDDGVVQSRGRSGTFVVSRGRTAAGAGEVRAAAEAYALVVVQAGVPVGEAVQQVTEALERLRSSGG
jgi:DNA-binding transcriptional regulator YhcF (GntR family)